MEKSKLELDAENKFFKDLTYSILGCFIRDTGAVSQESMKAVERKLRSKLNVHPVGVDFPHKYDGISRKQFIDCYGLLTERFTEVVKHSVGAVYDRIADAHVAGNSQVVGMIITLNKAPASEKTAPLKF